VSAEILPDGNPASGKYVPAIALGYGASDPQVTISVVAP